MAPKEKSRPRGQPLVDIRDYGSRAAGVDPGHAVEQTLADMIWSLSLAAAWLLIEYPYGLLLFILGAAWHWSSQRPQQIIWRHRYLGRF